MPWRRCATRPLLLGRASVRYYRDYAGANAPVEWIERPARTFDNPMQLPQLFHAGSLVLIVLWTGFALQTSDLW